jgi:hypothetical protein
MYLVIPSWARRLGFLYAVGLRRINVSESLLEDHPQGDRCLCGRARPTPTCMLWGVPDERRGHIHGALIVSRTDSTQAGPSLSKKNERSSNYWESEADATLASSK